jgi:hypothetical protein
MQIAHGHLLLGDLAPEVVGARLQSAAQRQLRGGLARQRVAGQRQPRHLGQRGGVRGQLGGGRVGRE